MGLLEKTAADQKSVGYPDHALKLGRKHQTDGKTQSRQAGVQSPVAGAVRTGRKNVDADHRGKERYAREKSDGGHAGFGQRPDDRRKPDPEARDTRLVAEIDRRKLPQIPV